MCLHGIYICIYMCVPHPTSQSQHPKLINLIDRRKQTMDLELLLNVPPSTPLPHATAIQEDSHKVPPALPVQPEKLPQPQPEPQTSTIIPSNPSPQEEHHLHPPSRPHNRLLAFAPTPTSSSAPSPSDPSTLSTNSPSTTTPTSTSTPTQSEPAKLDAGCARWKRREARRISRASRKGKGREKLEGCGVGGAVELVTRTERRVVGGWACFVSCRGEGKCKRGEEDGKECVGIEDQKGQCKAEGKREGEGREKEVGKKKEEEGNENMDLESKDKEEDDADKTTRKKRRMRRATQ